MSKRNRFPKNGRGRHRESRFGGLDVPITTDAVARQIAGGPVLPDCFVYCDGVEIEHRDGAVSCSLGSRCVGSGAPHLSGQTCGLFEPCARCGGGSLFGDP